MFGGQWSRRGVERGLAGGEEGAKGECQQYGTGKRDLGGEGRLFDWFYSVAVSLAGSSRMSRIALAQ